jgi:hypothetical protein
MKSGIRTYLLADTTLKAALATTASVFSFPAPQDAAKPYIVVSEVSDTIQNTIKETLNIKNESWQIDIYDDDDANATAIKKLVIARLNIADRVEMGSYTVYSCSYAGGSDTGDLEMTGSEVGDIRKTLTFDFVRDNEVTPVTP